jgi:nucleotide-binding universal stress UspA family protein
MATLPKKVLVCTDLTEESEGTARYASELVKQMGASMMLLYVVPEFFTEADLMELSVPGGREEVFSRLKAKAKKDMAEFASNYCQSSTCHSIVVAGVPPVEITRVAERENVDLIVMGCHTRTGLGLVDRTIARAHCPVLVVK